MNALLLIPWFQYGPLELNLGSRSFEVFPYQIAVSISFFAILTIAAAFARRNGRSVHQTLDLAIIGGVFALLFAVVFDVFQRQSGALELAVDGAAPWSDLYLHWSSHGAMVGGLIGALIWKWRSRGSLFEIGDGFAFALPFGIFIARLGCFNAHDHPGKVSDFFLAVADYQTGLPPYQPRHDMGLYDAIFAVGVAVLVLVLARSPRKPGFYIGVVAIVHPLFRFCTDFLQATQADGGEARYWGLTFSQYFAMLAFAFGVVIIRRVQRSP
jgi:phosphatidylglycerol:prolipoprotein diacylglycerol transferase